LVEIFGCFFTHCTIVSRVKLAYRRVYKGFFWTALESGYQALSFNTPLFCTANVSPRQNTLARSQPTQVLRSFGYILWSGSSSSAAFGSAKDTSLEKEISQHTKHQSNCVDLMQFHNKHQSFHVDHFLFTSYHMTFRHISERVQDLRVFVTMFVLTLTFSSALDIGLCERE